MEIDWKEINLIIQKRSSKPGSYLIQTSHMTSENYNKIKFILNDVNRFPDNQKTVAESGRLLRKYLSEKYCDLESESISRLVNMFCFHNK